MWEEQLMKTEGKPMNIFLVVSQDTQTPIASFSTQAEAEKFAKQQTEDNSYASFIYVLVSSAKKETTVHQHPLPTTFRGK